MSWQFSNFWNSVIFSFPDIKSSKISSEVGGVSRAIK